MEVEFSIETNDSIFLISHLIRAYIETKHTENLIWAVDPHNNSCLLNLSNIDKENFVLEKNDLLIEVGVVWIIHIDFASENMISI